MPSSRALSFQIASSSASAAVSRTSLALASSRLPLSTVTLTLPAPLIFSTRRSPVNSVTLTSPAAVALNTPDVLLVSILIDWAVEPMAPALAVKVTLCPWILPPAAVWVIEPFDATTTLPIPPMMF